jgi:GNAT superfamily N-acetyltransferase
MHDMAVTMTVDVDGTIRAFEARTLAGPHSSCPSGAANFSRLVGLSIRKGFLKAAAERIGGVEGCTHIRELLQQMATVAFQSMREMRVKSYTTNPDRPPPLIDSCIAWAASGDWVRVRFPRATSPRATRTAYDEPMIQTLSPLIREATAVDAESISRVRVASWRAAYRGIIDDAYLDALSVEAGRERYLRSFDPAPAAGFTRVAADDEGRVVGFATGGAARGAGVPWREGEVWMIYLLPEAQRSGLGTRLLRSMARGLDRRGLGSLAVWALARNAPARAFYEHLGGRQAAERTTSVGAQRLDEVMYRWAELGPLIGR